MNLTAAECARALHGLIEPIHATLYFAKDVQSRLAELGLDPRTNGYFVSRAAPLGRAGAGLVAATFYNFNPLAVGMFLPGAWDIASPAQVLAARAEGWEAMFASIDGPTDELAEATELAAAGVAACDFAGRPLGAANVEVEVPATPFAALQQHLTVLREHRGDGHIAVLTAAGLAPVEVLALYSAWQGKVSRRFLQMSRAWDDGAWSAGQESLVARGWVDGEGQLTEDGQGVRDRIEADTDRLAAAPYAALGEDGSRRLFALLHPIATAIDEGGVYPKPAGIPTSFGAALDA